MTLEGDVWFINDYLAKIPHTKILTRSQIMNLRKADKIEIKAGKIVEFKNRGS
jgi:copper(I)-binding protein